MATVKDNVRALLKRLPDDCTIDDVIYELDVIAKVEEGMKAFERGEVVSQEEIEEEFRECLDEKCPGPSRRAKT